jgi:hypothetical protein
MGEKSIINNTIKKKIQNLTIVVLLITTFYTTLLVPVNAESLPPSNFNATTYNRFGINLSWTNNENNNTYIEFKYSETWSIGEGNFLYNGTDTTFDHNNLEPNTKYYYQAWSYNTTNNTYSETYEKTNALTDSNQLPQLTNEQPTNNSNNIAISLENVNVNIQDPDEDLISWTIQGKYLTDSQGTFEEDGIKTSNLITPLPKNTDIIWYVNVTDGYAWVNKTYIFTTRNQYEPQPPQSFDAVTINRTQIDLTWTKGAEADKTYIEWSLTENWFRGEGEFLYNDSGTSYSHENLNYNTRYYYKAWSYNETDNVWNETASVDNALTDPNNLPIIENKSPSNNSVGINPNPALSVDVNDLDNDLLDVYWYSNSSGPWILFATNLNINIESGEVNLIQNNENFTEFSTKYWYKISCTDKTDWTNKTFCFTTRNKNIPNNPSNFIATTVSSEQINLAWTKTANADFTRIQRNTDTYPTSIEQGTNIYNGTEESFQDLNLISGTTYYYSAWGFNTTDKTWSLSYSTVLNTTKNTPTINNPSPTNQSTGIVTQPLMQITINDPDGDLMNLNWYSNSSGTWEIFGKNNSVTNGTYYQINNNFSNNAQTYYWYATVDDGFDTTNSEIYHFKTNYFPEITDNSPDNESINIDLMPELSITVSDIDADSMDVYWYSNSSGSWQIFASNIGVNDGTYLQTNNNFSEYNTQYYWYVSVSDGKDVINSEIYHFSTRDKYIPSPPNPFNANKINRERINLTWTKDVIADKTYIEWNSTPTWPIGEGNFIYNDTGNLFSHDNLEFDTQYYYQAWSWNQTDKVFSDTYTSATATTDPNELPIIFDEYPTNNSLDIAFNPTLSVKVNDVDDTNLDVYWYSNVSGTWSQFATNLSVSDDGVTLYQKNNDFSDYLTSYYWSINCTDKTDWTNETYKFTRGANIVPTSSSPVPNNESVDIDLQPVCNVIVDDENQDLLTVEIHENSTRIADTLSYQISSDSDDAYSHSSIMKENENYVRLHYSDTEETIAGLRFRNVQIPQGANITEANLCVNIYSDHNYPRCDIYAENVDDSEIIEGGTPLNERIRTNSKVTWNADNIGYSWEESPDIAIIIQEIINRQDWTQGNDITILINDTDNYYKWFSICDYQYQGSILAAKLNITYITDITIWSHEETYTDVPAGTNIVWDKYHNATEYNTTYWWSVNITDGNVWTNNTYHFKTRDLHIPIKPNTFSANTINSEQIDLSWNKGSKSDITRIQRKTDAYPTDINDGENIYNGTETSTQDTNLAEGTTYYYSAWSFNLSDHIWSEEYTTVIGTTNTKSTISNPNPNDQTIGLDLNPTMNITINDYNEDPMTIKWYSNTDGSWKVFGTNNSVTNGTYQQINSNFTSYNTTYYWYVTVDDGMDINTSQTFSFTTNDLAEIKNPWPNDQSIGIGLNPTLNITVFDKEGDNLTIDWYSNSTGTWELFGSNNSVVNGTYYQTNTNFSEHNTKYYWYVNVSDEMTTNTSSIFEFTTNNKPTISEPGPANQSINIDKRPKLNITVNDIEGDNLTINWFSNSTDGVTWEVFGINTSVSNGTYHQTNLNFSTHNTTYYWKVSVDDGKDTTNSDIYHFTTGPNKIPIVTDEYPENLQENVSRYPDLSITVNDEDMDNLDLYWSSNSSGIWEIFAINDTIDTTQGPVTLSLINYNFSKYTKIYWWSVNCTDGVDWVNQTFKFTTKVNYVPEIKDVNPINDSTGVCPRPSISISVNDSDGDMLNITMMTNATEAGSWIIFDNLTQVGNGTYVFTNTSWASDYNTKYWWSVNITDDTNWANQTFNFTTNHQPIIDGAKPNNSIIDPMPICNVTVNDNDNDLLDVYFYENTTLTQKSNEWQISDDEDDAYYYSNNMQYNQSFVLINYHNTETVMSGFRFRNINIPKDSKITSAYLSVYSRYDDTKYDDPACIIYGEYIDDSGSIEQGISLINRQLTTSNVEWNEEDIGQHWTNSSDISNIIQEIINHPGWIQGNNLTIITNDIQDSNEFRTYDYSSDPDYATKLIINYEEPTWVLQQENKNISSNSNVVWNKYNNASEFNKKYWWKVAVHDGCSWKNETFSFSTRTAAIPDAPSSLSAQKINRTKIHLNWTNTDDNNTYIEYNTVETWDIFEGESLIDSNSTNEFNHTGLIPNTKYYYQAWGHNTTDDVYSTTYLTANATTDQNHVPSLSNETPQDNTVLTVFNISEVRIDINETDGDLIDWTIEGPNIQDTGAIDDISGTKTANLITSLSFNTTYLWYVNCTDGLEWNNQTFVFSTRDQYIPEAPLDFSATTVNRTQINLSWTNDVQNYTYIEYNSIESWNRNEGILLQNSTENSTYTHKNLEHGTQYYYQVWRYNQSDKVFSQNSVNANSSTVPNYLPEFGSPNIINGSLGHEFTLNWSIEIFDKNGDLFDWYIKCNNSQLNSSDNDVNGTKTLELTNLESYTTYTIWVNATDGFNWTRKWFKFTTKSPYDPETPVNFTATSINRTQINISWDDYETNFTYIEWSKSPNWARGDGNYLENNSIITSVIHDNLEPGTKYYYQAWSYNQAGNVYSNYVTANATTDLNNAPILSTPNPANQSVGQPLNLTWSILINDVENDTFSWTIECNNTQSNSSENDNNGTKNLILTNLSYNTQYTIWVSVTDGFIWNNDTYQFTTKNNIIPEKPNNFEALATSSSKINLNWYKGTDADTTYIRYKKGSYPLDRNDGSLLYYGTGTSTSDSGLIPSTTYYYSAWSWSEQGQAWSESYAKDFATTQQDSENNQNNDNENTNPIIPTGDLTPPTKPTNVRCTTAENINKPTFRWDAATDSSGIQRYLVKIDDESEKNIGNVLFYTSTRAIEDGEHTFSVRAQDASPNNNLGSYGTCVFTIKTDSTISYPVARAGGPYYGLTYQTINFDGSKSYDPDGTIVSGYWDFDDGTNATGTKPSHVYNLSGQYNVTLTVTDNDGNTDTDITSVTIDLDTDADGWSDELEESYQTNINSSEDQPLDTDNDGHPDDTSPDRKYWGDPDDDNDGLTDDIEREIGSDQKNKYDVIQFKLENVTYFLVDINKDNISDIFYNPYEEYNTSLQKLDDGSYLIDFNKNNDWEYIFNSDNYEVSPYIKGITTSSDLFYPDIFSIIILIAIIAIVTIIYLFKIGYLSIEIVEEKPPKKKK